MFLIMKTGAPSCIGWLLLDIPAAPDLPYLLHLAPCICRAFAAAGDAAMLLIPCCWVLLLLLPSWDAGFWCCDFAAGYGSRGRCLRAVEQVRVGTTEQRVSSLASYLAAPHIGSYSRTAFLLPRYSRLRADGAPQATPLLHLPSLS